MDKLKLYSTASRLFRTALNDHHLKFPRPHAFRAYYEWPTVAMDADHRSITVTVTLMASDDAPSTAIKSDLDALIMAFAQGKLLPQELGAFTIAQNSMRSNVQDLDAMFKKQQEAVGDNYCECEGFAVSYTHDIVFVIPSDEAENALFDQIKDKII